MSNEKFDDIAVLSTLAQLRAKALLNDSDLETLRGQLKTESGKQVFEDLNNAGPKPEDQRLLARFSTAFAA